MVKLKLPFSESCMVAWGMLVDISVCHAEASSLRCKRDTRVRVPSGLVGVVGRNNIDPASPHCSFY